MSPDAMLDAASATLAQHVPPAITTALSKNPVGVDVPTHTQDLASLVATASSVLATAVASAMSSSTTAAAAVAPQDGNGECQLLGPFALFVQLALGGLALLSLVYKRWRERPQRPVKIWFFDVSKQVFGSVLVHVANVFMSMLTSGRFSVKLEPAAAQAATRLLRRDDEPYTPNPCSFYLLNLAIDTTAGIPILIILLRVITSLVSYTPWGKPVESIESGHYGTPPNAWWWLKQSVIYFGGLFGMKICVLVLFLILPWISQVGDWALKWTEGNERLQIVFVMMLFPLIMNAMQYYIIDSFIKKKETDHERLPSEDPDHGRGPFEDALPGSDEASESSASSENVKLSRSATFKGMPRKGPRASSEEYDPDLDGQTVSSSQTGKAT